VSNADSNPDYNKQNKAFLVSALIEKERKLEEKEQEFEKKYSEIKSLTQQQADEISRLQHILYKLQKGEYGAKSEKYKLVDTKTIPLPGFESEPEAPKESKTELLEVKAHSRAARKQRDLSSLPRVIIPCDIEDKSCACCGSELVNIGTDSSQELEYQPAKLFINVYQRPKYACNNCKESGVLQAKLPQGAKPLERSLAGAGLLTQIVVSKYVDHIPLHRQEQIFERKGVPIPRHQMCDWVAGVTEEYLEPLYLEHLKIMLKENYLQADETSIKVQDNNIQGKCHQGYLWGACSPVKKTVAFVYSPSRAGAVAEEIFKDYKGHLQTDLYAGYNKVILPNEVTRLACLAHVRRKFIEAAKAHPKETDVILKLIASLYKNESLWKNLTPEDLLQNRQSDSVLILKDLKKYLDDLVIKTLPKAPLAEALNYALCQWQNIAAIFEDPRFHLDNNMIERQIRPIAIGRKNYLFAGSHEGAKRAAIIYSMFGTAKLHKVNPADWLKYLLQNLRSNKKQTLIDLLPHNWIRLAAS
jgi:transposase